MKPAAIKVLTACWSVLTAELVVQVLPTARRLTIFHAKLVFHAAVRVVTRLTAIMIVSAIMVVITTMGLNAVATESPAPQNLKPFWQKPELLKKMAEDRAILVSVTHQKPNKQSKMFKLHLKGAGIVNTPQSFNQKKIVEYEKLSKLSSYVKETKYTPEKQELYVHGEAYTFTAKMVMKMKPVTTDENFKLGFEVIRGHLTGMKGEVILEDYERRKTLMSVYADHEAEKVPMPAPLLDFGLEIVLQQIAKKMRQHLESEFKKESIVAK